MPNSEFVYIDTQSVWNQCVEKLQSAPWIALDLEGNGFFRYPERICLIQLAIPTTNYILDPLAISDLAALKVILLNDKVIKVFHSCDNDLRALDRDFQMNVRSIFDTAIAAQLLGKTKLGLSTVLDEILGVQVIKNKTLQRQDWTIRPLASKSLAYAAQDVAYLLPLQAYLQPELQHHKKWDTFLNTMKRFETIRHTPLPISSELVWNIKGVYQLTDRQRSTLRELAIFRDALCRELDRAPFRVLTDETLIQLAQQGDQTLKNAKGLHMVFQMNRQQELRAAIKRGKSSQKISNIPSTYKSGGQNRRKDTREILGRG